MVSAGLTPNLHIFQRHDRCPRDFTVGLKSTVVSSATSAYDEPPESVNKIDLKPKKLPGNLKRASRTVATTVFQVDTARLMDLDSLSRTSARLMPRALLESLTDRIVSKQWESAIKVFQLLRLQEWYVPNEDIYVKLMGLLAHCKQPDRASELLKMILDDKLVPSLKCYTALLSVFMKSGRIISAFQLFESMKALPEYQPDVYVYTLMIQACCEECLFDRAIHLLSEMQNSGIEPNTVTYNVLIETFGKVGMVLQMEELFMDSKKSASSRPNVCSWNIVIKHCGYSGNIQKMEHWFEDLQAAGLQPNRITLNTLIYAYGKNGLYDKMKSVVKYMRKYLYGVDVVAFNSMIEAYGRGGKIEEMEKTFSVMKRSGTKFTAYTLCCLIRAYSQKELWDKVESLRRQWKNSDLKPDVPLYNSLIHAYRRAGSIKEMEAAFAEMRREQLRPDKITFTILFDAYKSHKMLDKAAQVKEVMQSCISQAGV